MEDGEFEFDSRQGKISLLFSVTFPPALGPVNQQSPGLKRLERVTIHHQDEDCFQINIFLSLHFSAVKHRRCYQLTFTAVENLSYNVMFFIFLILNALDLFE
jgi:hypothetical protein